MAFFIGTIYLFALLLSRYMFVVVEFIGFPLYLFVMKDMPLTMVSW